MADRFSPEIQAWGVLALVCSLPVAIGLLAQLIEAFQ
jgi:hypothetical protein